MKKLLGNIQVVSVLLNAVLGSPAHAHFIGSSEPEERERLIRHSPNQVQRAASPLFEFEPFQADAKGSSPPISDPLGMNAAAPLKLFSGVVENSDLLESFRVMRYEPYQNVELPAGTVSQYTLVTNYVTRFFNGKLRAADRSLTRLKGAGHRTWMGLPTTKETSPLTLAGFGYVGEWIKPIPRIWLNCDGIEKRIDAMVNAKKQRQLGKKPLVPPSYCFEI